MRSNMTQLDKRLLNRTLELGTYLKFKKLTSCLQKMF